jgi:UDP:flavonoid glycosyltransferase YjiC (YdhE family)
MSGGFERRPRLLFIAEAVTLAHAGRLMALASALAADYEVCFACDPRYDAQLGASVFERRSVATIPGERFLAALAKGTPFYDAETLARYVEEDRGLIADFDPDAVIGDFRLSLDVSAKLSGTPYLNVTNGYWSPYAKLRYPVPELPFVRFTGVRAAQWLFDRAWPIFSARHSLPYNQLRQRYGLPRMKSDTREIYAGGTYALYADVPELVPVCALPQHHRFIGPILWSPAEPQPLWWNELPRDRPLIYVTLGSSGDGELLSEVLSAFASLPVFVIAATAGRVALRDVPANARVAEFLSGQAAVARAAVVISNGGSATSYQALAAGVPVLGIASNLDQFIFASLVAQAGAGLLLRARQSRGAAIRDAAQRILNSPAFKTHAEAIQRAIARRRPADGLRAVLDEILPRAPLGVATPVHATPIV